MESSRRLAVIMFTDLVGYTALMGKDSAKAMEVMRRSRALQKPLVEKYRGKWLKEMGDGALAQFDSALDAVNCAVEIQKAARAEEAGNVFTEEIKKLKSDLEKTRDPIKRGDGYLLLSRIYAFRGDGHEALKYLTEYANLGFTNGFHDFILIDPFFESLRDDPVFTSIVKKAQDEKAAIREKIREMEERGELEAFDL